MYAAALPRQKPTVAGLGLNAVLLSILLLPAVLVAADGQPGGSLTEGTAVARGKPALVSAGLTGIEFRLFRDGRVESASPLAGALSTDRAGFGLAPGRAEEFSMSEPMDQPQCTICLVGTASVSWVGSSGSFHVDQIANYRSTTTGLLDLRVALTDTLPVWGQTISYYSFSDVVTYNPLLAGYAYNNVNSGTIGFYGSQIPAGNYYLMLYLRNNGGYVDWLLFPDIVTCNGAGCTTVQTCTEDSNTMCLIGGRYRVTSYWKNQYAGGVVQDLHRATLTGATGAFWLNDANTYEYLIRINTATDNGRAWIAIPTFTDVEFWILVEDLFNGQTKTYHSLPGNRTLIYDPSFFIYP